MKSIELFAGIGGIALAAEWAGIETVAFCEREPFCQQILTKHWPNTPILDDIRTLNKQALIDRGVDVGAIELITGGFPCQPYSIAGKQRGTDDDRDLWPEMFRLIEEIRPTWVVGENVANFAKMELDRSLSDLESIGYTGRTFVLPAAVVEAPHERMRTFIVAHTDSVRWNNRRYHWEERHIQDEQHRYVEESDTERKGGLNRAGEICSILPNTGGERCNEVEQHDGRGTKSKGTVCQIREHSKQLRRGKSWWDAEPDLGRVAHGVPYRVDRIRGLGNAVVPAQIYPIFEAIVQLNKA